MKLIKIKFVDFYKGFNQKENWFYKFLSKFFLIEISESPDFIIYSSFGHSHLNYSCTKIFYTGENERPNYWLCDWAVTFDFDSRSNHLRLPLYVIWEGVNYSNLLDPAYQSIVNNHPKSKFCCFLVSNPHATRRIEFFKKLNAYKKVDSGGKVMNNLGYQVVDKLSFLSPYKFVIAFENSGYPGYVTEKIYEPFFTNTIPIYWGSESVSKEFNPDRFLNRADFSSDEELIDKIIYLEEHDEAYREMILQPVFIGNTPNEYFDENRLANYFEKIFEGDKHTKSKGLRMQIGIMKRKWVNFYKKYLSERRGFE